MQPKQRILTYGIAATIALGGAGGAFLGLASPSSGAESASTAGASTPAPAGPAKPGPGRSLAVAATAIGISEADLTSALQSGKSIAEVAKDKGVDVQKVVDALLAEQRARIQSDVERKGLAPAPGGPGRGPGGGGPGASAAAAAIGISESDLAGALRAGKSMAEVAKDKGVDEQKVIDALVAERKARLEADVANGRLTRAEADAKLAELPAKAKLDVERQGVAGPPHVAIAATALGIGEADLLGALRSGKSIAEVAKDKGVDGQKAVDALVAERKARLDADVANGRLTRADADAKLADHAAKAKADVERKGLPGGP